MTNPEYAIVDRDAVVQAITDAYTGSMLADLRGDDEEARKRAEVDLFDNHCFGHYGVANGDDFVLILEAEANEVLTSLIEQGHIKVIENN